jgi:hypothetical protein
MGISSTRVADTSEGLGFQSRSVRIEGNARLGDYSYFLPLPVLCEYDCIVPG